MDYVYKYVLNDEIIYIGKSHDNFKRLMVHGGKEDNISEKWHEEINKADIYYTKVANQIMADVVESELIRRYKPKCNAAKKSDWDGLMFPDLLWHPFRVNNKYYEKISASKPNEGNEKRRKQVELDHRLEKRINELTDELNEYKEQLKFERQAHKKLVKYIEETTGKKVITKLIAGYDIIYELIDFPANSEANEKKEYKRVPYCPFDPRIIELPNLNI